MALLTIDQGQETKTILQKKALSNPKYKSNSTRVF